uniref:protein-tyrosine-phosphatase n=1 Tax=Macaca nemestrina TaxID=9545 RepID=A0A2K6BEL6_MACNE
ALCSDLVPPPPPASPPPPRHHRLCRRRLGTGCMIRPQSSMSKHIPQFCEELKKYGVTTIVRVCEATYDTTLVEEEGIHVLDWPFDDGAPPSNQIVDDWLSLVKIKFREEPGCCIAVHCVAGLGRAPVLVALALIEGGMKYEDAVQFIRQKRRGAFNKVSPKMRLRFKDSNGHRNNCCIQ